MKKRALIVNMLISMLTICHLLNLTVSADVIHLNGLGFFSYNINNNEVEITMYQMDSDISTLDIPDQIEGYPVVKICEKAFFQQTSIQEITIPKGIQEIGLYAIGYEIFSITNDIESIKQIEDVVIHGYKGTAAEAYANENGFNFIALDEPAITTTQVTTSTTTTTTTTTTVTTAVDSSTSASTSTEELATTNIQTTTAVGTTTPTSAIGAESIVTTEISTVPTTVTTPAVITTETGTKLPQTGYSIWYQSLVVVAMGMVGVGSAVVVRSGMFRKKR